MSPKANLWVIAIDRFAEQSIELSGAYHICWELAKQGIGRSEALGWGMGHGELVTVNSQQSTVNNK